jgi:hypothetical protein
MNEEVKNMENHGITTMVHQMKVNGFLLVERKQKTIIRASDGTRKMTIFIHIRSIDDYSYDVRETFTEGKDEPERIVETQMTQKQVKNFEKDWSKLWKPQAKLDNPPF